MKQLDPERLDTLVLARLAVRAAKPPTVSGVGRALYSIVAPELRQHEWKQALAEALGRLRAEQLIEAKQLVITERGRTRLGAALGLGKPPIAKTWDQFRKRYLPRLFLEHADAFEDRAPNCAAVVLAERLAVVCHADTTPRQVVDAWLARELDVDVLSLEQLRNTLLARELQLPRRKTSTETLRLCIAHLSGAPSAEPARVLSALTLRWLRAEAPRAEAGELPAGRRQAEPAQDELDRFVDRVRAAAQGSQVRCYGDDKVFIDSVWQALSADSEIGRLGETGFKRRLVEAHRLGALVLGRADLVSAMDPRQVRASEIKLPNATYHFIHRGQPA